MMLDNVPNEAVMDAIEEYVRNARLAYLANHPECTDATVEITSIRRTSGHCDVDVKIHPVPEPKMNVKLNVTLEKKDDETY